MEHDTIVQNKNCKRIKDIFPWPGKIKANFEETSHIGCMVPGKRRNSKLERKDTFPFKAE